MISLLELLLFAAVLGAAALALARRAPSSRRGLGAALVAGGVLGLAAWRPEPPTLPEIAAPRPVAGKGYATSGSCRSCHPSQHATWRGSFHRTMTQVAGPLSIAAPLVRTELRSAAGSVVLVPRDGTFHVESERFHGPVVMTTGSHHLQVYWLRRENGAFVQLPWVWFLAERRWIPVTASFLQPPGGKLGSVTEWNSNCVACHSVGGEPRIDLQAQRAFTRAAELGIACEACHGPAAEHARANRDPGRRYALHRSGASDPTVVNPRRLASRRATEACGQCHSVWVEKDFESYLAEGKPYRAGRPLAAALHVVRYDLAPREEWHRRWMGADPEARYAEYFWKDGTVRVTGREYNGLLESACFTRGELSCLTCHRMHGSEPDDQLKDEARMQGGDETCLGCHGDFRRRIPEHTRHKAGSSGAACYNCHMPHTTWGLFTAMRSHRIDSPSAAVSARTGRPNACNQCHLDRTLAWTAERLSEWYGQPPVELSDDERRVPASVLWLLQGDAAQRAVAAWTLGWQPARQASGDGWQAPLLARALDDPYAAVRYVAWRSLRRLPGYEGFRFDFVRESQDAAVEAALARWRPGRLPVNPEARALFDAAGRPVRPLLDDLKARRDDRAVVLSE